MQTISPLKPKLKSVPASPGVYFWRDKTGKPIYIGRAVNLKQHLSNYFQKNIDARIAEMVSVAQSLDWQITENLLEAIILEANLIKKYWPKYNVKDRDNRSFIYIVIPRGDYQKNIYPRPIIIRGQELKKFPASRAKIFGPYQSYYLISRALRLIRPIFPYSTCRANSGKPCFDYQIGLCPGVCVGAISPRQYQKNINNLILLLNGDRKKLLAKLIKENPEQANTLKHLRDVSLLTKEEDLGTARISRIEGYDISHLMGKETYGSMVVFINNEASPRDYRLFKIKEAPAGDDERALSEMLVRRFKHGEWPKPDIIMIDGGRPQISFVQKVLNAKNINIPIVGISKFGGDKLVFVEEVVKRQPKNEKLIFTSKLKSNFKELADSLKPILLQVREEAHRFAITAGRRARRKII